MSELRVVLVEFDGLARRRSRRFTLVYRSGAGLLAGTRPRAPAPVGEKAAIGLVLSTRWHPSLARGDMHRIGGLVLVGSLTARRVGPVAELESTATRKLDGERVYSAADLAR